MANTVGYVYQSCVNIQYLYCFDSALLSCVQAVALMVEECCRFVEQAPDLEIKLKLIDTLRTVTDGKVRIQVVYTSVQCISTALYTVSIKNTNLH